MEVTIYFEECAHDEHTEHHCDKCGELIFKENLIKYPYLYLDRNDKNHKDLGNGYRQYYICKNCWEKEFEYACSFRLGAK
jgi:hypothetical protein